MKHRHTLLFSLALLFMVNVTVIVLFQHAEAATYRQGSTGAQVRTIQDKLKRWGYYDGAVDGIFGSGTRQAVVAFQNEMRLSPDGIVGPRTWNALYDTYLGIGDNVSPPGSGSFAYTVKSGDTLWLLARRFNTTVDAIMRLNGLTSDLLNIGQVLQIPG